LWSFKYSSNGFVYRKNVGKCKHGYSEAGIVVTTQDNCSHVELNSYRIKCIISLGSLFH
jgi:hypothetical protein